MLYAEIEREIDAAHFLMMNYKSPCQNQHGHRWRFKVFVASEKTNENGMIIDFSIVKAIIKEMDHTNLNKLDAFKKVSPTAENIVIALSREIQDKLDLETNKPICYRIECWETPSTKMIWERDS